jgi:hypothetical protein
VPNCIDYDAVETVLAQTLERERLQSAAIQELLAQSGDPSLTELKAQADRHQAVLEQLAREVGADLSRAAESDGAGPAGTVGLVAKQRLVRLGWLTLQQAAYASGDKRIDRAVRPVLREKERQGAVLEMLAVNRNAASLFKDPE